MNKTKEKTLHFYTSIFKNFDVLKNKGILTSERIDEIKSWIAPEAFIPAILQDGRALKDFVVHTLSRQVFNTQTVKDGSHWLYCSVVANLLTDEEVEILNRDANEAWRVDQETKRYDKAEKIPESDWRGPVYCEGLGYNDGYFSSIEDLHDDVADSVENEEEDFGDCKIDYVWACDSAPVCQLNLDSILERETEEAYEGFDTDELKGYDELATAIEKFNELNKDYINYMPNFKKCIILNKSKLNESI